MGVCTIGRVGVDSVGSEGNRDLANVSISSDVRSLDRIGVESVLCFSLLRMNLYVLFQTSGVSSSVCMKFFQSCSDCLEMREVSLFFKSRYLFLNMFLSIGFVVL